MTRQCCFCPSTDLTREHLWGEWIGEVLGKRGYRFFRKSPDEETMRPWNSDALNANARFACGPCNSEWMSDLENQTKQIISEMLLNGTPKTFTIRELATLAALVFTKSVVADAMGTTAPFLSFGERSTFRRTLQVPRGVNMWFGRFANDMGGVWKSDRIISAGNTALDFHAQIFTFGFGYLFIQAITGRWKRRNTRRPTDDVHLTQDPRWQDVCIPFWPVLGNSVIKWPPTHDLLYSNINALADRWKSIRYAR